MLNEQLTPATTDRAARSLALRTQLAGGDAFSVSPIQQDNGDEALYADKSGTYTKGILQDGIGIVNQAAYASFKAALASGNPHDFDQIVTGGPRTQNGPQGGLAFYLDCLDSSQLIVPPAPALSSEEYAAELIELYWASLLRDVPFGNYGTNQIAANAASELTSLASYAGPRTTNGQVTTDLLFRGTFVGENLGPYISQFLVQDADFGALPIVQKYRTNSAHVDFMLDPTEFLNVENGIATGKSLTPQMPVYLYNGRGLAAYTHEDVLYEAYFIAYLVMSKLGVKLNSGNPYAGSKTQNGFATMGGPDIASTLAAVAGAAIRAVWYQKWWVHLRHRPESGGGIVHLLKTGKGATIQGHVSDTVLKSKALAASYAANNNSYFLSQAFPEGSPTHPAYPTGHGAVAGACITVLKFFFDGDYKLPSPRVSLDGTTTPPPLYTGPDAGNLTVNGELHKLASNISFGHGVHAGIHWRSDTKTSIELGEAVALSYLRDHARTYNESFSISITKVDGSTVTIAN
jgi:hypothetical protein